MPRPPDVSAAASLLPPSIFTRLVGRLAQHRGEVYPFHIGDTHLMPPGAARLEALEWAQVTAASLYRYGALGGEPALAEALCAKLRDRNGIAATPASLQVTAGATHACSCVMQLVCDPGDEVILLAPFWPLIRGQIHAAGGVAVEVPFSARLYEEPDLDVAALLAGHVTPRTAAIYVTTPNNPDGKVLDRRVLEAVAGVARERDLWVLADEVYEDYTFEDRPHVSIASLPGMAERTLTVYSFSKSHGQAGLRVGYVAGPEGALAVVRRLSLHSVYNVPVAMQRAAQVALAEGGPFLAAAREAYWRARDRTVDAVLRAGVRASVPEGGSYVFVDFAPLVGAGASAMPALERLAAGGVLLAPGDAFGKDFAGHARLCYTSVDPERLEAGLEAFVRILRTTGDRQPATGNGQ